MGQHDGDTALAWLLTTPGISPAEGRLDDGVWLIRTTVCRGNDSSIDAWPSRPGLRLAAVVAEGHDVDQAGTAVRAAEETEPLWRTARATNAMICARNLAASRL